MDFYRYRAECNAPTVDWPEIKNTSTPSKFTANAGDWGDVKKLLGKALNILPHEVSQTSFLLFNVHTY